MNLAWPWALWLCVPVLAAAAKAWTRRPPALRFPDTRHLWHDRRAEAVRRLPLALEIVAGLLLVLAAARPQQVRTVVREERQAVDVMLVLDVSGSMDAVDIGADAPPEQAATRPTRLACARREIERLVATRPEDRFGLVVFARRPYPACPLTFDHALLRSRLEALTSDLLDDGTGLTAAIALAAVHLRASPSPHRVMILLTDGRDNVPADVPPEAAAAIAAQNRISVYVVGIGSASAVVPVPTLAGVQYRPVETPLDEPRLRSLAARGGGLYFPAGDDERFAAAMARIETLEKGRLVRSVQRPVREFFPALTLAAIALLGLAFGLARTASRALP